MILAFVLDAPRQMIEVSSSTFFAAGGVFAAVAAIWLVASYVLPRRRDKPRLAPAFWYIALTAAGLFAVGAFVEQFPFPPGALE